MWSALQVKPSSVSRMPRVNHWKACIPRWSDVPWLSLFCYLMYNSAIRNPSMVVIGASSAPRALVAGYSASDSRSSCTHLAWIVDLTDSLFDDCTANAVAWKALDSDVVITLWQLRGERFGIAFSGGHQLVDRIVRVATYSHLWWQKALSTRLLLS
ncbi:hypothetical protein PYCCODRAFT_720849 [Trametes coccinea BRFM310]|uniref:Uncharacterized protein n=1 Tax=Trametes coccinea (strain BRFM310) TaxID=1353009 RepID=A0A1Y2IG55_TRAC3|nr:hypothetical protein PYCCODRAFT_720849 [Trametes coccinea BRFM310]